MIYFEDLVIKCQELLNQGYCYHLSDWTKNFIQNVASNLINREEPKLSTNQAHALKKVMPSFIKYLAISNGYSKETLELMVANPTYKRPLYVSPAIKREVRHLGGNFIGFRFKYNPQLAKDIQLKAEQGFFRFDKETKLWIVTVTEQNIQGVVHCIRENRFEIDELTQKWLDECGLPNWNKYEKPKSICEFDENTDCVIVHTMANEQLNHFILTYLEGVYV
jgi:hypothetical protein